LPDDVHAPWPHRFCFCPRGDTASSRRVFDAVAAGCIPVITEGGLSVMPYVRWERAAFCCIRSGKGGIRLGLFPINPKNIAVNMYILRSFSVAKPRGVSTLLCA